MQNGGKRREILRTNKTAAYSRNGSIARRFGRRNGICLLCYSSSSSCFFFFFFLFWVEKMNVVTAMVGWVGVLVCLGVEIVIIEREERDGCGDLPFG